MTTPLVSVSIITYNHENYIAQALDSALMQKVNFLFEIVVSDDCSKDNTRKICLEYQKKYPDIIKLILHDKNMGSQANALDNFKNCTGKYISVLEGDDYWTDPEKLQLQTSFMEANPTFSMSFTNVDHVDKDGKLLRAAPVTFNKDVYTHDDLIPHVIPPSLTIQFKKESFPQKMPDIFYTLKHSDGFIKAIISLDGPVKYFNRVTGSYRVHDTGVFSGASFEEKNYNKIASFKAISSYFSSKKVKKNVNMAISNIHLKLAYYQLSKGRLIPFINESMKGLIFSLKNGQLPTSGFIFQKVKNKIKRKFNKV